MNGTTASSSRLLKITAATARWLLGLLIGAWLLLALSVAVLHGWIVPRIGDYRGALETQASRVIGVPVRIGSISARSDSLFPTFELGDVVLHDAQQREALRLGRIVASVSPRSLWRLGFEQLYVERPQLDVRLDALGRLHVAGLEMPERTETSGEARGADWFFAQRELVIRDGTVRWTDERRGAPPLLLGEVEFVTRNRGRQHMLRLDATPPAGWGERFSVRGEFRQPLLSARRGHWQTWSGEIYADLPRIDVTQLGQYLTLDARIREGSGGLRLWADVERGEVVGGAADLALARVDVDLDDASGAALEPLVLRAVTGRIAGQRLGDETIELSTTHLQFDTADGMRWPGGNLWLSHTPAQGRLAGHGALRADRLDLAALALIAGRLPLGAATHGAIARYVPRGLVERIEASWQGPLEAPQSYQARGLVRGLSLASQPGEPAAPAVPAVPARAPGTAAAGGPASGDVPIGTPGVRGATLEFDATQAGGRAKVSVADGALDFPGVFEEPVIPLDSLAADLQWKLDGGQAQLQVTGLRFANTDAQGEARASWRTSDPEVSGGGDRFPGVLDLEGRLTRADGTRVFRYLPLVIPKDTRDYVRDAVSRGTASAVDFRVRGDLHDMPFRDPRQGEFRIAARVANVTYAYVPPVRGEPITWPALQGLSGELVFEGAGMRVRNARGRLAGAPGIEVTKADAQIADMDHDAPLLKVDAQARGALDELLRVGAPLAGDAAAALGRARASGSADYRLGLELPLAEMNKTRLRASIVLAGNELQFVPEAPPLTQVRGKFDFTEAGFSVHDLQGQALGGELRLEGSGRYDGSAQAMDLRLRGTASAEGLRDVRELAHVARNASGSTAYSASFSLRDGATEFTLDSSLQGLALALPAPFAKPADASLPLAIEKKVVLREPRPAGTVVHDRLSMRLGDLASADYVRDISGDAVRVLRGAVGVGLGPDAQVAAAEDGVFANIRFDRLDLPAWQALLGGTPAAGGEGSAAAGAPGDYLPTRIAVQARELTIAGRTLHDVVLGGTRDGVLWRANVDARELSGYAEYRDAQAGRLYARLARLQIAPSTATAVESLLDEEPGTLPALDIVVDDFELFGRHLGRAEIDAVNRGGANREWRLNRLVFRNPDASFEAQGSWAAAPARGARRRTAMDFRLDIADAGALLARFGMPGLLRDGKGRLEGQVHWSGSPFALDYPSLGGQLHIDVGAGQFLKAEPGIAKLLGVLSLQALPRRLALDFRDVFSQGFAFDFLRGDARIERGVASTNNLQMKGVNAAVLMDGSADIAHETQDIRVVVVPEINAGTAALVATAINPAIGLGTFLAQMVLSKPLIAAATQEFQIDGTWADPKITKVARRPPPATPDADPSLR